MSAIPENPAKSPNDANQPAEQPPDTVEPAPQPSPEQQRAMDYWYSYVNLQAGSGLRSEHIKPTTVRPFTLGVHKLVADHVTLDLSIRRDEYHAYIDRRLVQASLADYFAKFPPFNPTTQYPEAVRTRYQDHMIAEAKRQTLTYPEIAIVRNLRLAFWQRKQAHATRGMYALLTAYGRTLLGDSIDEAALLRR